MRGAKQKIRSGISNPLIGFTISLLAVAPTAGATEAPFTFAAAVVPPGEPAAAEPHALWLELDGYEPLEPAPAATSNDLFARLRDGFAFEPVMNGDIRRELDWLVRHPEYLERVFGRAQRYMPYIVEQLDLRGLPLELALLPVVESGYDPFAYSHGRAAGLWQFIPGTAKHFGIRQTWWYDGRRDIVDSTNGALNYLDYLHELMDGDWLLAVASYNAGGGTVGRAVRNNLSRSKPASFWHLSLPRETRNYVPRLLALVTLVREPETYGATLPPLVDEPQFATVDLGAQLDLALAAELAGVDVDTLYAFNSGYNRWATDPEGPHRLVLPVDLTDSFNEALAVVPDNEWVRWQRHKVRSGETISEIAADYHTTIDAIRRTNGLSGNTIRAGAFLTIPVASKPLSAYSKSADARRTATQNRVREGSKVEHSVRAGESFWSISRRYGVSMRDLAAWNAMAPGDTLSVGHKLVIWTTQSAPTGAPAGNTTTRKLHYTVRRGDSLYVIANRFRVTVADLLRWNGIDKDNILRPGQQLTMYVDVTRQSS